MLLALDHDLCDWKKRGLEIILAKKFALDMKSFQI